MNFQPLVELQNVTKEFSLAKQPFKAVNNLSLSIFEGETLGLVGESGCGKSTVGKMLVRLLEPTQGKIFFENKNIGSLSQSALKKERRKFQIVFQDPYASLNPRMTIQDIIGEPLAIHDIGTKNERSERIDELLYLVGLHPAHKNCFPHEFSGGQRQRIGIARALAINPKFLVCDEPISALDVSIQAQIVNLFKELQNKMGLTYLFIAHDLAMIKYLSTRVAVMYLGSLMELAHSNRLYTSPLHPYTKLLFSSVSDLSIKTASKTKKTIPISEKIESRLSINGCPFQARCPYVQKICKEQPPLQEVDPGHFVACHFAKQKSNL